MEDVDVIDVDVLVVGGGGAAARAALEAARAGAQVVLAVKGHFGSVGTRGSGATASGVSESGRLRVPEDFDGRDAAFSDILQLGLGVADPKLARVLVEGIFDAREDLKRMGAVFGGSGIKCHGVPVMSALESAICNSPVTVRNDTMVTDLLVEGERCVGAVGVDEINGRPICFRAGAMILGTGGAGQLYEFNMDPDCVTGDGYAMGYRAGAELINMEFSQVMLGSVHPTINLAPAWVWGQHPRITNRFGEEFIQNYLPAGVSTDIAMKERALHAPFSTRDEHSRFVDSAMIGEVKAGRTNSHRALHLDLTGDRPAIAPSSRWWWRYRGIDLEKEPMEAGLCHQCSNGGLRIGENGDTTLPGLYAAGEVAGGPHGADRRGGNMLAASQVFGARAGKHAAGWSRQSSDRSVSKKAIKEGLVKVEELLGAKGSTSPEEIARLLRRVALEELMIVRSEASLQKVLDNVSQGRELLKSVSTENPGALVRALEVDNMLLVAEMTARAAMMRTESRGGHYRADFPKRDDCRWLRAIRIRRAGLEMRTDTLVLDPNWQERPGDMGNAIWG